MDKSLTKKSVEKRSKEVEKRSKIDLKVGDRVINDRGDVYRVAKISKKGVDLEHQYDEEWHHYGTIDWYRMDRDEYIKIDRPYEEIEKSAFQELQDLSKYETKDQTPSDSTEIASRNSKEALQDMKAVAEAAGRHIEVLRRVLERKRVELGGILAVYQSQAEKIQKVLDIIELYLGVHEEIIVLREGLKCPMDVPIMIRQKVLFMDEEFADTEDQGLCWKRLRDFDNWIVANDQNLDRLLPEKRGIVVLRVRRNEKEYFSAASNSFIQT